MGILNQFDNGISDRFLKSKKFIKGAWGSPDYYTERKTKNKFSRSSHIPHWNKEHQMYERYFENYYIYYFPESFEGYVNIDRKNIQNHAGYIIATSNYSLCQNDYEIIKVNDEADFNMALNKFKKIFEEDGEWDD